MSQDSLRLGLEAGGGVLPGPTDLGPPTSRGGLLQTPVCDLRTPGTPKPGLDMMPISTNSNGGAPTLTTPTLTPTTLRNIEQMFAESDPHEPPHHYEHAAGFAPPIISPTSGNSYVPLGQVSQGAQVSPIPPDSQVTPQVTPLNCHRPPSPSSLPGPPDLCPLPTKPARPTNLSLSRPPPLLEAPPRHRPTCLLPPQQQAADLSLPSPTRGDLSISLVKPQIQQLAERQQVLHPAERPPANLGELRPTASLGDLRPPASIGDLRPPASHGDLRPPTSLGDLRPPASHGDLPPLQPERPHPTNLALTGANLLSHKLDMMDKLLKAVAASATITAPKQEPRVSYSPPPYREEGRKVGGRRPTEEDGCGTEEEGRRAMRRERNKQAAARCRKRRMDLTSTLQVEVDQWEEKVRGLKEELLQLESQKKGLEAVLRRHQGPCKIHKQEN